MQAEPVALRARVPQGSPLSPLLFLLYILMLYEELEVHKGIVIVGFADDTNMMTASLSAKDNCAVLERAWVTCEAWAKRYGMAFAPQKSELLHFSKAKVGLKDSVTLSGAVIKPKDSVRFLGVFFGRRFTWKRHLLELRRKLATQQYAVTKLGNSAWGTSVARARQLYIAVVRSALAYGAATWHSPAVDGRATRIAKELKDV